jgi:NAD(P)-dependent dehydrogenase (short-subunit alcohol dehydrogenase family)
MSTMSELRFDGQVAIVTGAGGQHPSLGRSHANLLAERGAKVVVNDLGVGPNGRGVLRANAEQAAEEIRAAGGEAVADQHSVADEDGARNVVATALETRVTCLPGRPGRRKSEPSSSHINPTDAPGPFRRIHDNWHRQTERVRRRSTGAQL